MYRENIQGCHPETRKVQKIIPNPIVERTMGTAVTPVSWIKEGVNIWSVRIEV